MGAAASVEPPVKEVTDVKVQAVEAPVLPKFDEKDKIDIFAKEMYLSSPKIDALQHVLSEEAGREAFMKFLRTEYAAENLDFFIVSSLLMALLNNHCDDHSTQSQIGAGILPH